MKSTLPVLVLLLMGIEALASTTNSQTYNNNGNNNSNSGGSQTGNKITTTVKAHRRTLKSLFQRDPDFEFAMGILARNAQAAEKSVDQIVADIKKGTVDPQIVQASLSKGLIIKAMGPKPRRSLELEARKAGVIQGPKGVPHAPSKIAQHIASSGYIPPKIMEALIASKHYLRPGQTPENPTARPQSGPGIAVIQKSANHNNKKVFRRDLEGLYARDIDNIYAREAAPGVTHDELKALIYATQRDPEAEKAVYQALTMDPNVEKVTENLVKDWTTKEDMEKRDAMVEAYLEAREAEADYLEAREAEAEAEADWEE